MTKACDVSVWTYWPLVVCVCDDETGEVRDYLPERTCTMEQDGMFLVCSKCGVVLMGNPRYCSRCGAKVVE